MHSPMEIAKNYIEVSIRKTHLSSFKMVILGIFAGIFVGLAGVASTAAAATVANPSLAKIISAFVFPAGIAMVLIAGSELFTGNSLIILAVLEKKTSVLAMLKNWFFVFLGNFIGASFVAVGMVMGHTLDLFGGKLAESIIAIGVAKCNLTFVDGFIRGIFCNVLVCIAVWMSYAAKNVSGKLITSFWPIMVFVLCGFEHSVANMFFGVSALLAGREYNMYAQGLTVVNFLVNCLIPVTLGNIVGGAGIVGYGYWLGYLSQTPLSRVSKEQEQEEVDIAEEY